MQNFRLGLITLLSFSLFASVTFAKEIPVQGRFFIGSTTTDAKNLNENVEPLGLKKMEIATKVGFEITYPIFNNFNVGARYTKYMVNNDEQPPDPVNDYNYTIDQDSVLLVARLALIKSDNFIADVFAGYGGANTTFKLKTASQSGEMTRKASEGWFATPYSAAGASISVGAKQIYFNVEAGYEQNKADSFTRTGSISTNLNTVDLSGPYVTIGLVFDGIPGTVGK